MLMLTIAAGPAAAGVALPDIGESSAATFSEAEAERAGAEMVRRMRRSGRLLEDPVVTDYVADLGRRLASYSDLAAGEFTFLVIKDPTINAFALPGGYIGVHTGLILASRNEGELAAVLAHEIAHVTQAHIARGLEEASRMNLPLTAAVIAAILLGGSNPEVGQAATAATQATAAQHQLNFTRSHEREADRVGMDVLADAGFDPEGMPAFFERLQEKSRYYSSNLPELLRTHPVTSARIADARNRASRYGPRKTTESSRFELARVRLEVAAQEDAAALARRLRDTAAGNDPEPAERYRLALALQASGRPDEAAQVLRDLAEAHPDRVEFTLALVESERDAGRPESAAKACRPALDLFPRKAPLVLECADALIRAGHPEEALQRVRELTATGGPAPRAYRLQAKAEEHLGHAAASHISLAQYYHAIGEPGTALTQLDIAERSDGLDFYHASRIEALRTRYRQDLQAQRRE